MNPLLEKLYYKSPVLLQNLAVSLMGLKLRRERYHSAGKAMLEQLMRSQNFNAEQMHELRTQQFVHLARHAISSTRYYRDWARKLGISANDIQSLEDLEKFPVIEKAYIRTHAADFRADNPELQKHQFVLNTSGTTGTPLTVYSDIISRSKHYAFFTRLRAAYGVVEGDKRATLFGRIILTADQTSPPFWRYDCTQRNLLMSSYHLTEANLIHYYNQLVSYRPAEIFAYPSSIYAIAAFIVAKGLPPITLKLVMTTAENLLPHQREVIQRAFNAPLVNQYGCTEMAFFCSELPESGMVFHPEHGFAEVRDSHGNIQPYGQGELLATGFINYSMPVIRYLVGDQVNIGPYDHQGRQPLLDVAGRIDDVIYTLQGAPVGRLDPIFKGGSGIKCAQIYQFADARVELRLVPDENYTSTHGQSLKDELIKRLGSETPIDLVITNDLAKEKNGKFRPVVSLFKKS